jgi:hypothetical protein
VNGALARRVDQCAELGSCNRAEPLWSSSGLALHGPTRACSARAESMGFDGIHGAFWIGDSIGIDSPLGEGNDACGLLC